MATAAPCPTDEDLRRLLHGADAPAALESHLDTCARCRAKLDTFSGAGQVVPEQPSSWRLARRSDGALARAIAELGSAVPSQAVAGSAAVPLGPPRREGDLGQLGPYHAVREIGRGGMGVVFEGFDPLLRRRIALKVLSPVVALDPDAKQRFLREAQAAATLMHENVVAIHTIEEVDGVTVLVLQYVEGETLGQRLAHLRRIPLDETLRIGLQVARGLAAAHEQGLVHRDIKPGNILLEAGSGRARLADFGLAKPRGDSALTTSGALLGTPEYMAPEQVEGREADARADLFSLGTVLYAAVTGGSPFRGDNLIGTLDRVRFTEPPRLDAIDHTIPQWFADLVARMMQKNRDERLASSAELVQHLEQGSAPSTVISRTAHDATLIVRAKQPIDSSRGWQPVWVLTVGGTVLIALATWRFWPGMAGNPASPQTLSSAPTAAGVEGASEACTIVGRATLRLSFRDAVQQAQDGDVIEIRGPGPIPLEPMQVVGKRLTIRAADGPVPVLLPTSSGRLSRGAMLTSDRELRLEGLDIRWSMEPFPTRDEVQMLSNGAISVSGGRLLIAHCRIFASQQTSALSASRADVRIIGCQLRTDGAAIRWDPAPESRFALENSACGARIGIGIFVDDAADTTRHARLEIDRATFRVGTMLHVVGLLRNPQRLDAAIQRSVLDAGKLVQFNPSRGKLRVDMNESHVITMARRMLTWSEKDNVLQRGVNYLSANITPRPHSVATVSISDIRAWERFWRLSETGSQEGQLAFTTKAMSGDAPPQLVEVTDASGPISETVGADYEQLGPGAAYHRWRASDVGKRWPEEPP